MNKNKYYCNNRSEDGVALIFALTMLALLLIMLIGFLASSLLEQRTAYAQGDSTASRLLAKGTLRRVISQLSTYSDDLAWMRFRSSDENVLAPIVSIANDGDLEKKTLPTDLSQSDEAYAALKPLLHRYFGGADGSVSNIKKTWEWRNFFPSGTAVDYPQWIYYYNNPDKDQITGRIAYVVVPNFGIDPIQLGKDDENQVRIGQNYKELKKTFFLKNTGVTKLANYSNYLTLDLLTGKNNLENNTFFAWDKLKGDYPANDFGGTSAQGYKEFVNLHFTTKQMSFPESYRKAKAAGEGWDSSSRTFFDFGTLKTQSEYQSMLATVDFQPANLRNQVAANIRDYMDEDNTPSSDVAPADWLSSEKTPEYTGNEKTAYINQIVPAVQAEAEYNINVTSLGSLGSSITQNVSISKKVRIYAEVVNIYPESLRVGSLKLKNFNIAGNFDSSNGTFLTDKTFNQTVNELTVPINADIPANSYKTVSFDVTLPNSNTVNLTNTGYGTPDPINITAEITALKFDRAVLYDGDGNAVDCVDALTADSLPYKLAGENIAGEQTWSFQDTNETRQRSAYVSFEVEDPRCNLASDQWQCSWNAEDALFTESSVPNLGSINSDVDASNDDLAEEKDLQSEKDPANMVVYIRNNVMKSPWELGFIHRGTPWQTINLKSVEVSAKNELATEMTYFNDGLLMDKLKFTNDANTYKFNINYPTIRAGIFDILLNGIRYHAPADISKKDMDESDTYTTALSDTAKDELTEYISMKYYDKKDKFYPHYVSRAQLVNVITNWARNGSSSPVKGESDIHIEEFIGKIVPLTRCGDTVEHFTVFAVAQSIKDVKGTAYIFNTDGSVKTKKSGLNHGGTVECEVKDGKLDYYDKITSETFLVARLRRELTECKNYASCRQGVHGQECKFKITVIESYTLNEP